jgi:hypothetical protein
MRFTHELRYAAPPSDVRRMVGDPAFREAVCKELHALRHEVSVDDRGADMTVVVDQTQPARGIPAFASKFVGDEIRLVQREEWTGPTSATMTIEIPGKPGSFAGTMALSGSETTTQSVAGDVTVKLPLIAGKLESLVADVLTRALVIEERVGRSWLAS